MPDMSALDEILVEIAQTALPSTRRHSTLERERNKKTVPGETAPNHVRPSLPNLTYRQDSDLNLNQRQQTATSSPPLELSTNRRQTSLIGPPKAAPETNGAEYDRPGSSFVATYSAKTGENVMTPGNDNRNDFTAGSCTFPRRSNRYSDLRQDQPDFCPSQVTLRRQNDDDLASISSGERRSGERNLRCPFDTVLNLEFVDFCSDLACVRLPESVRQSFRRAATYRKKKWRKSMDQMLYTEQVICSLSQPATGIPGTVGSCSDQVLSGQQSEVYPPHTKQETIEEEDSEELNAAVRTFEQTLQRHLSNTYKDESVVGALKIVEDEDDDLNVSYHAPFEGSQPVVQYYYTIPEEAEAEARESLFTVPPKRLPKSASTIESGQLKDGNDTSITSHHSSGGLLKADKSLSCTSLNSGATITISATLLESIREKLATSLAQMQILQARAELIPKLEEEIVHLQGELSLVSKRTSNLSDTGVMTSPEASPLVKVALTNSATNTAAREMVESSTACRTPSPELSPSAVAASPITLPRNRRKPVKGIPLKWSSPRHVKRCKRPNAKLPHGSATKSQNEDLTNSSAELDETSGETNAGFELDIIVSAGSPVSSDDPIATYDNCEFADESPSEEPEPEAALLGPSAGADVQESDTIASLETANGLVSHPQETATAHAQRPDQYETGGGFSSSFLPAIYEESSGDSVNLEENQPEEPVVPAGNTNTNTVSTSGVSEDSNTSMSSSNSDELEMIASQGTSESSEHDDDEGSYDLLDGQLSNKCFGDTAESQAVAISQEDYACPQTVSKELLAALKVLKDSLHRGKDGTRGSTKIETSLRVIQQEWFSVAGSRNANCGVVNTFLDTFEALSKKLLNTVVNLLDSNGNTVLHYALSHNNFPVVSVILDSKVCNVDMVNQAGYSPVMLASLAPLASDVDRAVALRLFGMGDINRRAHQHGQTSLMLAVSHGRADTVKMLLQVGADLNIQAPDSRYANHVDRYANYVDRYANYVDRYANAKTANDIDVHLTDQDGMCALYVAMEAAQKEIAALIYAKSTAAPVGNGENNAQFSAVNPTKRKVRLPAIPGTKPLHYRDSRTGVERVHGLCAPYTQHKRRVAD
ncbi:putative KN motif and ankyrin repeat domain-containing protein 2 [Hypsibius exemplaris]|uniref:KN motif and ankyrin repeat domain-containing protein 2 n=1 Tax=Hypsibius exemplaris TaxID=2072580 RepID=A0A1W0X300_HYPEX|nr:putative KN motif and ankyrin repeat domain-containing protein 2 [Hypsibius exemplaris]